MGCRPTCCTPKKMNVIEAIQADRKQAKVLMGLSGAAFFCMVVSVGALVALECDPLASSLLAKGYAFSDLTAALVGQGLHIAASVVPIAFGVASGSICIALFYGCCAPRHRVHGVEYEESGRVFQDLEASLADLRPAPSS